MSITRGSSKAVISADYDNDGWPDLFLSAMRRKILYHNNGNGTFTDVTDKAGIAQPLHSFGTFFFDYDNDGWPDLFVTDYDISDPTNVMLDIQRLPVLCDHVPSLPQQSRRHLHRCHPGRLISTGSCWAWALNFGDLDNDGWPDFYVGTGNPRTDDPSSPTGCSATPAESLPGGHHLRQLRPSAEGPRRSPSPTSTTTATRISSRRWEAPTTAIRLQRALRQSRAMATTGSPSSWRGSDQPLRDRRAHQSDRPNRRRHARHLQDRRLRGQLRVQSAAPGDRVGTGSGHRTGWRSTGRCRGRHRRCGDSSETDSTACGRTGIRLLLSH